MAEPKALESGSTTLDERTDRLTKSNRNRTLQRSRSVVNISESKLRPWLLRALVTSIILLGLGVGTTFNVTRQSATLFAYEQSHDYNTLTQTYEEFINTPRPRSIMPSGIKKNNWIVDEVQLASVTSIEVSAIVPDTRSVNGTFPPAKSWYELTNGVEVRPVCDAGAFSCSAFSTNYALDDPYFNRYGLGSSVKLGQTHVENDINIWAVEKWFPRTENIPEDYFVVFVASNLLSVKPGEMFAPVSARAYMFSSAQAALRIYGFFPKHNAGLLYDSEALMIQDPYSSPAESLYSHIHYDLMTKVVDAANEVMYGLYYPSHADPDRWIRVADSQPRQLYGYDAGQSVKNAVHLVMVDVSLAGSTGGSSTSPADIETWNWTPRVFEVVGLIALPETFLPGHRSLVPPLSLLPGIGGYDPAEYAHSPQIHIWGVDASKPANLPATKFATIESEYKKSFFCGIPVLYQDKLIDDRYNGCYYDSFVTLNVNFNRTADQDLRTTFDPVLVNPGEAAWKMGVSPFGDGVINAWSYPEPRTINGKESLSTGMIVVNHANVATLSRTDGSLNSFYTRKREYFTISGLASTSSVSAEGVDTDFLPFSTPGQNYGTKPPPKLVAANAALYLDQEEDRFDSVLNLWLPDFRTLVGFTVKDLYSRILHTYTSINRKTKDTSTISVVDRTRVGDIITPLALTPAVTITGGNLDFQVQNETFYGGGTIWAVVESRDPTSNKFSGHDPYIDVFPFQSSQGRTHIGGILGASVTGSFLLILVTGSLWYALPNIATFRPVFRSKFSSWTKISNIVGLGSLILEFTQLLANLYTVAIPTGLRAAWGIFTGVVLVQIDTLLVNITGEPEFATTAAYSIGLGSSLGLVILFAAGGLNIIYRLGQGKRSLGGIFPFISFFLVPVMVGGLFMPIVSYFLRTFDCTFSRWDLTWVQDQSSGDLAGNRLQCWTIFDPDSDRYRLPAPAGLPHIAQVAIAAVGLSLYYPLSIRIIGVPQVVNNRDIQYNPAYLATVLQLKFLVATAGIFLTYHPLFLSASVFLGTAAAAALTLRFRPCGIPWINRLRTGLFSAVAWAGLVSMVAVIIDDSQSLIPFWLVLGGWGIFVVLTIFLPNTYFTRDPTKDLWFDHENIQSQDLGSKEPIKDDTSAKSARRFAYACAILIFILGLLVQIPGVANAVLPESNVDRSTQQKLVLSGAGILAGGLALLGFTNSVSWKNRSDNLFAAMDKYDLKPDPLGDPAQPIKPRVSSKDSKGSQGSSDLTLPPKPQSSLKPLRRESSPTKMPALVTPPEPDPTTEPEERASQPVALWPTTDSDSAKESTINSDPTTGRSQPADDAPQSQDQDQVSSEPQNPDGESQ